MDGAGGEGPFAGDAPGTLTPVLRVSQLDAFELDAALEQLVWSQFSRCFQHFKPGHLTPFEAELKALLQLLLWRFTVCSHSATAGQALLNITYGNGASSAHRYRPMSRSQKLWFALCTVGDKWLQERAHGLLLSLPAEHHARQATRAFAFLSGIAKVASLLNFLHFLRRGGAPTLLERLLGVRAVFSVPQGLRHLNFQHLNRELLWHGFAEFLIFLLPLLSMQQLRARAGALLWAAGERTLPPRATECAFCGDWATMPHTIGCSHVFCYYCIKGRAITDVYLSCPACGSQMNTLEPVKMHIEMTELH